MLTSVVIPCLDRADDTRECLAALAAQRDAGDVEVILVDNGSKDPVALRAAARTFPRVTLLRLEHNLGFAGGVNRGLRVAQGDVLVVLNNDTMPAPCMLARMRRAFAATPRPAMTAPVSNYVKGSALVAVGSRGESSEGRARLDDELGAACGDVLQDVDFLSGLCLMFERELVDRVGGFDEAFGLGNFEDDDLSLRVRLVGGRLVIVRDAFLHHWGSRTFEQLGIDCRAQIAANQRVMDRKWQHDPAWAAIHAAAAGDTGRAGELAVLALAQHPHWPEGQLLIADAHRARGEFGTAAEHAARFLQACPASWTGHVVLVLALLGDGRLREATRAAHRALSNCYAAPAPAAQLLDCVAQACIARGERAAARQAIAAALEIEPSGTRFCQLGTLHFADGQQADAVHAFSAGARQGHIESAVNLGLCQWQGGQGGAGLRTLTDAVLQAPNDARARAALAAALQACASAGADVSGARAALALVGA